MRLYDPDVVLGSKRHPLSDVYYPPLRRLLSWTYHKLTRLLFRVNVRDTQTGLKLIRRDVLAAVLPRMLEKRYAFDLEFLVVARSLGFARVFEAPVRIDYRFASHVDPGPRSRIVRDTLAIFYRHHILDTYRGSRPARERGPAVRSRAPAAWRRSRADLLHQLARRREPGGRRRRGRDPRGGEALGGAGPRRDAARLGFRRRARRPRGSTACTSDGSAASVRARSICASSASSLASAASTWWSRA